MTSANTKQSIDPKSPWFAAWARFVLRFRIPLLLLTLGLTAFFAHAAATRLRVDTTAAATISDKSDAVATLEDIRDRFGDDSLFIVLVEGDVYSLPYLERLKKLQAELAAIDLELESLGKRRAVGKSKIIPRYRNFGESDDGTGDQMGDDDFADLDDEGWGEEAGGSIVQRITSILNVRQTLWKNDGLIVEGLFDDWPSAVDLPAIRKRVGTDNTVLGQVVNPEGTYSALLVNLDYVDEKDLGVVYDEVVRISEKHQTDGFQISVGGHSALGAATIRATMRDLGVLGGTSAVVMIILLFILFRHPLGVIGPLLVVGQGTIWTFGFIAVIGSQVTLISNILPAFLFCVGLGDSVHVQSTYRDARRDGMSNHDAIVHSIATTGKPVMYTTLTTCLGLLSFYFAYLRAITDFGVAGAFGVFATLIHSVVFLPIVLSFNTKSLLGAKPQRLGADLIDRGLALCDRFSSTPTRRRLTLAIGGLIGIAALAGSWTIRPSHNDLNAFPSDDPIIQAIVDQDENMGGSRNLVLLVEAPPGKTLKDRDILVGLQKLEKHILAFEQPGESDAFVTNATSILDPIRESHRALHSTDPKSYRLPDTQAGVNDMFTMFESSSPSQLKRLMTVDAKAAIMNFRVKWRGTTDYIPILKHVDDGIQAHTKSLASIKPGGGLYTGAVIMKALLWDLVRSFGIAFGFITVLMVMLLGELRLGLLAMIPNLLPVLMTLGMMGVLGIPLDMGTLLVASIALGIAVDDTIHFLHQFRSHLLATKNTDKAIRLAFQHSGRAMITTSVVLVCGFGVFLSAEMNNVSAFGTLVAVTVIFALLVDLIYTPAVLRTFFRADGTPALRKRSSKASKLDRAKKGLDAFPNERPPESEPAPSSAHRPEPGPAPASA